MCIICDNSNLGSEYLSTMQSAIDDLKRCEKILLSLSNIKNINFEPTKDKTTQYNKAHKRLVLIRKSLNNVKRMRINKRQ